MTTSDIIRNASEFSLVLHALSQPEVFRPCLTSNIFAEAAGRDESLSSAGGGDILHAAARGVHSDASDKRPQL